jgi:hypothetical protein
MLNTTELFSLGLFGKAKKGDDGKVIIETRNNIYHLAVAFEDIGNPMYPMTDLDCCRLLAYVLQWGTEQCVLDMALNAKILLAQRRLNIGGGCVPNIKLLPTLQQAIKEAAKEDEKVYWLPELCEKLKITPFKSMKGKVPKNSV